MTEPTTEQLAKIALASAYQAECLAMCNRLFHRDSPYRPMRAYQALGRRNPVDAVAYIAEVIDKGSEGLGRLAKIGRIGDSFEASVLHPRWARLFDDRLREVARGRLRDTAAEVPAIAPQVAEILATERIQFDQDAAYRLAGMTAPTTT